MPALGRARRVSGIRGFSAFRCCTVEWIARLEQRVGGGECSSVATLAGCKGPSGGAGGAQSSEGPTQPSRQEQEVVRLDPCCATLNPAPHPHSQAAHHPGPCQVR